MSSKIQKWGNSLGIRLPKNLLERAKLKENAEVVLSEKNGVIMIAPAKVEYSLQDLVDQISKNNVHGEIDFKPEGQEVW